jgi:peptidoglycan/LPS O-acetylase OafA/YrhL
VLGRYRLLLAALVALSHVMSNFGLKLPSVNFGAAAVVCFYFISGYLMYFSFGRFREHTRNPASAFYADRLIRLYPSYLLVYAAASLWIFVAWRINIFDSYEWISEILVVPTNFTLMALPLPLAAAANPPTWSLGAEFQFYLLLPLVMIAKQRGRVVLLVIMLAGQLAAMTDSGPIEPFAPWCRLFSSDFCYFPISDLLAYRWLPLSMAPFLLGVVVAEQSSERWLPWPLTATVAVYGCAFLAGEAGLAFQSLPTLWISFAMALLVPIAYVILRQSGKPCTWDRLLGNLAYPLFLDHILCISITNKTALFGWSAGVVFTLLAVAISSCIAVLQIGIDRIRYRWRGFGALVRPRTQFNADHASGARGVRPPLRRVKKIVPGR